MVAARSELNQAFCTSAINPEVVPGWRGRWPDIPRDAIDLLRGDDASEETKTGGGYLVPN
jgi:hypothetical protein